MTASRIVKCHRPLLETLWRKLWKQRACERAPSGYCALCHSRMYP